MTLGVPMRLDRFLKPLGKELQDLVRSTSGEEQLGFMTALDRGADLHYSFRVWREGKRFRAEMWESVGDRKVELSAPTLSGIGQKVAGESQKWEGPEG
jgi:hypothetical protein